METTRTLQYRFVDACDEFESEWDGDSDDWDLMHEIADNALPIYYWDIAQYAAQTSWLMTEIPEINSEGNAHDQIQANIYQAVMEGLYEHKEEKEDA